MLSINIEINQYNHLLKISVTATAIIDPIMPVSIILLLVRTLSLEKYRNPNIKEIKRQLIIMIPIEAITNNNSTSVKILLMNAINIKIRKVGIVKINAGMNLYNTNLYPLIGKANREVYSFPPD